MSFKSQGELQRFLQNLKLNKYDGMEKTLFSWDSMGLTPGMRVAHKG